MTPPTPSAGPFLGYVRVSTEEQGRSGAGLIDQEQDIRSWATRTGHTLAEVIVDTVTGKHLERPGITRALDLLDSHQAAGLVVAKLDRLSRSLLDFSSVVERSRRRGWQLVALDLGVDTSTAAGEMMANVLATFAQFERRIIGERTKAALAVKKAQGVRIGRPRTLPAHIRDIVRQLRAAGVGYAGIANALNENAVPTAQGGARWYASTVRAICRQEQAA